MPHNIKMLQAEIPDEELSVPVMLEMLERMRSEMERDVVLQDLAPALADVIRRLLERRELARQAALEEFGGSLSDVH